MPPVALHRAPAVCGQGHVQMILNSSLCTRRHNNTGHEFLNMSELDACLEFTLKEEGGYVNDKRDPGGATNMGITLATYRSWCGNPQAEAAELRMLSRSKITCIYGSDYWNRLRADALPAGLDLLVFDFAVTCGTVRSARELQTALGLPPEEIDGSVGPETLSKARLAHGSDLIAGLATRQSLFYRVLPAFSVFGRGWLARTERRRVRALAMAGFVPVAKVNVSPVIVPG
jgi:lysozyme family protein